MSRRKWDFRPRHHVGSGPRGAGFAQAGVEEWRCSGDWTCLVLPRLRTGMRERWQCCPRPPFFTVVHEGDLTMRPQRLVYAPTRSRRLNEMLGLCVLAAAALLLLALATYTPSDPSFDPVGGAAGLRPAR